MIPLAQWTSCVLSLAVLQSLQVWIKPRPQNKGTNDFPRYCKMVYLMWGRFFSSLLPSFLCSFLSSSFFPFLHSFLFSDPICHCQRCDNMSWHKQLKGLRVYFGLQFHGNTSWWGRQNPRAAGRDAGGKSWLGTWSLHSWIREWLGSRTAVESCKATPTQWLSSPSKSPPPVGSTTFSNSAISWGPSGHTCEPNQGSSHPNTIPPEE